MCVCVFPAANFTRGQTRKNVVASCAGWFVIYGNYVCAMSAREREAEKGKYIDDYEGALVDKDFFFWGALQVFSGFFVDFCKGCA